jgi:hypothetical protein
MATSNCPDPPGVTTPPIQVTVEDIACPDHPTNLPFNTLEPYFRDVFCWFNHKFKLGRFTSEILAAIVMAPSITVTILVALILALVNPFITGLAATVFSTLDQLRKTLDPSFALFASSILNELLGTDYTVDMLPQGTDINAHLQRAETIGFLFHKQLMSEFLGGSGLTIDPTTGAISEPTGPAGVGERITPATGIKAAARFTGLAINFATATGIIATIGGLVPEVHLDELREIGEQVAKNLGLGRLQRLALAPIVQILLAEPYRWFINELARPTQFGLGEVVNPYTGAVMPASLIWRSLARAGYSDDKIAALLELHRKKLTEADLLTLLEGGHYDQPTVTAQLKRLGYDDTEAEAKTEADHLRAQRPFQDELRSAVTTAYADGHILQGEMESLIDSMPLSDDEKALAKLVAQYKKKVPSKHLTLAELQTAFEKGIIDLAEFTDHLTNYGYSDDDQSILLLLTLDKLDAQKQKAAAAAARAAAKASKGASSPLPPATPPATSSG